MAWRPERAVELLAGTPAGGGQDRPARTLIEVLRSHRLIDVPAQLLNVPGRGGGNAWDRLAQRPADAHLLAISSPTLVTNKLRGVAAMDQSDLTPLAMLYTEYIAFVARADSPLHTAADLLARLREPSSLTIAMATATGNTNHIAIAHCTQHAGGDVQALQLRVFDSALHAIADVLEARADVGAITAASAVQALASGRLRALALTSPQRLPGMFAGAPTWRELGVGCVVGTWRGVVGPAGLSPDQIAYWDGVLGAASRTPEWNAELARRCWTATYMDSRTAAAFIESEAYAMRAALAGLGLIGKATRFSP